MPVVIFLDSRNFLSWALLLIWWFAIMSTWTDFFHSAGKLSSLTCDRFNTRQKCKIENGITIYLLGCWHKIVFILLNVIPSTTWIDSMPRATGSADQNDYNIPCYDTIWLPRCVVHYHCVRDISDWYDSRYALLHVSRHFITSHLLCIH